MRKVAVTSLALAAAAALAAPAPSLGAKARSPLVPTRATLDACQTGTAPAARYAIFSAQMGAWRRSARMELRFALFGRIPPSRRWRHLRAPGLDQWYASASPQVAIFRYRKEISALVAPGAFRAVVRFRWLDGRGRVIRSLARTTRTCRQPDPRPDLRVTGLTVARGDQADRERYVVGVRNTGRGNAGPFAVRLTIGRQVQPELTVAGLPSQGEATLVFDAPRCTPGTRLRVVVDSDHQVSESSERNNTLETRCRQPT